MPRGKLLNQEEKAKITAYKDAGLSNREIALRIKRSHHVINNFIKLVIFIEKIIRRAEIKSLREDTFR